MNSPLHIKITSIFLLVLLLNGCSKSDTDPNIIFNLEEEFTIEPIELLSRSGNQLSLRIKPALKTICSEAEILYNYNLLDGVSVVELIDIAVPENCQTNGNSPKADVPLVRSNPNTFNLNVTIKEIIENLGTIDEYADRYEMTMSTSNGIKLSNSNLSKIKEGMLWGGVDYNTTDSTYVAEAFQAEVNDLITDNTLDAGHFGHFQYVNNQVEIWNDLQSTNYRLSFAYKSGISQGQIAATLNKYRDLYPNIRFFAYNAFGESF